MAEASQYRFDLRELTILLIKERGIRSGKWILGLEISVGVGNFGDLPAAQAIKPGVITTIGGLSLTKVSDPPPSGPEPDFVVDAATVYG